MKIGVTSENKLKVNAVIGAYAAIQQHPEVTGYAAISGVGEQPIDDEALLGAKNRIDYLKKTVSGLDRIISIESGIFLEKNNWVDRAVVVIYDARSGEEHTARSEGVVFPTEYVERARAAGFDKVTVGQAMLDAGYITNAKDPHLSISGVSRQKYIEDTVGQLVRNLETKNNNF